MCSLYIIVFTPLQLSSLYPNQIRPKNKIASVMRPPKKRLFICCDGTGNDAVRNKNDMITNVARFARCLKQYGEDGILQLVYYHEGIGTKDGIKQYRDCARGQSREVYF